MRVNLGRRGVIDMSGDAASLLGSRLRTDSEQCTVGNTAFFADRVEAIAVDRIADFKRSYAALTRFHTSWLPRIQARCSGHDQREAAFYVWARYSMSMRTLDALSDPHLIPDLSVICRGCLEFDVALEAVMRDPGTARDYLEFVKHAKARYLRILGEQNQFDRMLFRRQQFEEEFGESPEEFGRSSWCARQQGITGLMRSLERTADLRIYNILSHFAHGSVWAVQTLDGGISNPEDALGALVNGTYVKYLKSSQAFVQFVWEPLTTPEGERCKCDFNQVLAAYETEPA